MSAFVVCVSRDGATVPSRLTHMYGNTLGSPIAWHHRGAISIGIANDSVLPTIEMVDLGSIVGVGVARLDNRDEVRAWLGGYPRVMTDLELVTATIATRGCDAVGMFAGDFAFVVWNAATRTVIAARDIFGVRPLYYKSERHSFALASRAMALAGEAQYDRQFIADYLASSPYLSDRTIVENVRAVPPASLLTAEAERVRVVRYWNVLDFPPDELAPHKDRVEQFRSLFTDAVRARLTGRGDVWSQLSGGLDSSSVVSQAQTLAERADIGTGIAGTVTMVDSFGDGDEREFSDTVVRRYGLRNETICDAWAWQDDGSPPPLTDQPRSRYPFFARDRRLVSIVRAGGGRVLLSGHGSDSYLSGPAFFLADWIASGRVHAALREALNWSVLQRQSFWTFAKNYLVMPFLPPAVRQYFGPEWASVPRWIDRSIARQCVAAARAAEQMRFTVGENKHLGELNFQLNAVQREPDYGVISEGLEYRYPFLDRRLVEFALRLPITDKIRPVEQKWILRQAMTGILPELIRTRTGKGGSLDPRFLWSLGREEKQLNRMLADPILAQLGFIDGAALRTAVNDGRRGRCQNVGGLMSTLSLETWLAVRSGHRIPRPAGPQDSTARIVRTPATHEAQVTS